MGLIINYDNIYVFSFFFLYFHLFLSINLFQFVNFIYYLLYFFESTRLNVHAYYFSSFHTHDKNNKSSKPKLFPFILIDRGIQATSVIYVH
jgi:hypothetical protein